MSEPSEWAKAKAQSYVEVDYHTGTASFHERKRILMDVRILGRSIGLAPGVDESAAREKAARMTEDFVGTLARALDEARAEGREEAAQHFKESEFVGVPVTDTDLDDLAQWIVTEIRGLK